MSTNSPDDLCTLSATVIVAASCPSSLAGGADRPVLARVERSTLRQRDRHPHARSSPDNGRAAERPSCAASARKLHGVFRSRLTETKGIRTTFGSQDLPFGSRPDIAVLFERTCASVWGVDRQDNTPQLAARGSPTTWFARLATPGTSQSIGGPPARASAAVPPAWPRSRGIDFAGSIRIPASSVALVGSNPRKGRVRSTPTP